MGQYRIIPHPSTFGLYWEVQERGLLFWSFVPGGLFSDREKAIEYAKKLAAALPCYISGGVLGA